MSTKKSILIMITLGLMLHLVASNYPFTDFENDSEKGIQFHKGTWEEALEKAKEEDKLIFLDIYATWCGPCKKLKAHTFSQEDAGSFYNKHFINVALDGERGEGKVLAEHFNVVNALSMKEKMKFRDQAKMREFTKGETVYLPNDFTNHIFFLKKGHIKVLRVLPNGEEQMIEVIGPGELFGGYVFAEESNAEEMAEALTDAMVCYTDKETWNDFIKSNHQFTISVLKLTGLKLKSLKSRVEDLQLLNRRERIINVLKNLTDKHGRKIGAGFETELRLNLTHNDIAKLADTSRQSVTTVMNELQKEEIISYDRRRILIRQYEYLEKENKVLSTNTV